MATFLQVRRQLIVRVLMLALALGVGFGATAPGMVSASGGSYLRVSSDAGYGGYAKVRGSNFQARTVVDVGVFDADTVLLIGRTTARTTANGNFVAWVAQPCDTAVDIAVNHALGGYAISRHLRAPGCVS